MSNPAEREVAATMDYIALLIQKNVEADVFKAVTYRGYDFDEIRRHLFKEEWIAAAMREVFK